MEWPRSIFSCVLLVCLGASVSGCSKSDKKEGEKNAEKQPVRKDDEFHREGSHSQRAVHRDSSDEYVIDDHYRKLHNAAKNVPTPAERGIIQKTFMTPEEAYKQYQLAIFTADEKRLAEVAGPEIWEHFNQLVQNDDDYIIDRVWQNVFSTYFARFWSTEENKHYELEYTGDNQAVALCTAKYLWGGTDYHKYVEISFTKTGDGWKISNRTEGDVSELSEACLKRPVVSHPEVAAVKTLQEDNLARYGSRMRGVSLDLTFALTDNGQMKPEVLELLKDLTFVSMLEIRRASLTDEGLKELLPHVPHIQRIKLKCGHLTNAGMESLIQLAYLDTLELDGNGNGDEEDRSKVTEFPFAKLTRLTDVTVSDFLTLSPTAFASWSELKGLRTVSLELLQGLDENSLSYLKQQTNLRELSLREVAGQTDQLLSFLAEIESFRELNLESVPGITDEGFKHLAKLPFLGELTLRELPDFTGRGFALLNPNESYTLDLRDLTLNGDDLEGLTNHDWGRVEFHNVKFTGSGLKGLAAVRSLFSLAFYECEIDPKTLSHLADVTYSQYGEDRINLARTVDVSAIEYLAAIKYPIAVDFRDQVTDADLKKLHKVKNLQMLSLDEDEDKVSKKAIEDLKAAIPGLTIWD